MNNSDSNPKEIVPALRSFARLIVFGTSFILLVFICSTATPLFRVDGNGALGGYGLVQIAIVNTAICLISILLARVIFKVQDDTCLGLKSSFSGAFKHLLLGFLLGGIFLSIVVGALSFTGGYRFVAFNESPNIMPFFLLFFVGAFNEELVFRGFIFQDLERVLGTKISILISSFLFGFVHMINHVPNVTPESQMVFCTFLSLEAGLPFVMAFILTRSIWFAVGIHWAWNFFEGAVFGANVSGHELNSAVMLAKLSEGVFGGGGAFGPENTLVSLFAGIGLFYFLYRLK